MDPVDVNVFASGVYATALLSNVNVWGWISDDQTPAWAAVSNSQTSTWTADSTDQTPTWYNISDSQPVP